MGLAVEVSTRGVDIPIVSLMQLRRMLSMVGEGDVGGLTGLISFNAVVQ